MATAHAPETLSRPSIDPVEVEKFSRIAAEWWDPESKFKPLHKFNPVRLGYIRDVICAHFGLSGETPFKGLRMLDIGCGGGLVCEPMARLGASITGVDAAEANVKTASVHAAEQGLEIDYRHGVAEQLLESGEEPFDVVLNLEVMEHVANPHTFLADCAHLVKPGGLMICATINRTSKAFAMAIVGAEWVMGWLPRGTHRFGKLVKPGEIRAALREGGMTLREPVGVGYNPLTDQFSLNQDVSVNYMVVADKPAG
ncbi:bifunctional 2-polyprenyl-6-hydroxyphenol methylase/3-demethylubiquinol 3-O-methyltransferase UbiG [Maricaulis parjimensis]|uniref:bifunctional 2-polyprenyl-6-hydroxyphenol methylase/3-demethylubiquinol 3-O-methyltransferase UbiG n=1 Tax=Maricaulis parjimensis TaxID=144023 RepID=UPI00193AB48C|nr:bifunctional 2-polyprenyl-6-hydroxyphenol methylase/3-demethylubiquinol 3-O-methyltransferase UbiG [Maricaulis parjimensis]